ncbi:MAG: radical SAM protein [Spirochaetota bacterium]|nr:radical SAM protein [Spirochaetota bacterium]
MKVLLLNPSYPFEESPTPPFGLMSLGAYLLERGIEVRIEDYIITPYSIEAIKNSIGSFNPDVVGATGVTMNINNALRLLKDCKSINPDVITAIGGPHVTFDSDKILHENIYVDYIIRGEGELTFTELLEKIDSKSSVDNIKGISYRKGDRIINNESRPFIEDINVLPFPARNLIQLNKYKALGFPINMVTSRGCPFECIFCVGSRMMGRKVRYFKVDRVVDEFEQLASLGFNQINIVDDLFTSNKERCIAICNEIIDRKIKHSWNAFARVNTVSKDLLEKLKEAGCNLICFGIESGNQNILNTIKKKITLEQVHNAINLCNDVGIEPMCSYIMGLPGENKETAKNTYNFAKELNTNYGFHILSPFPGSEVREKKDEYGIRILTDDWDKYDANQAVSETDGISHNEINKMVNDFNTGIDLAVEKILEQSKKGKPIPEDIANYIEGKKKQHFIKDILIKQIVETYSGLGNGAGINEVINDFIDYIKIKTNYSKKEIRCYLMELFSHNCLRIEEKMSNTVITWT